VIVTAGSDDKCAACLALGADHAINYRPRTLPPRGRRLTGGRGVNVVLDMVAGDYVAREVECLAEDGRLVIIAVQGGVKSEFNAGLVLRKRCHHRLHAAPAAGGLQGRHCAGVAARSGRCWKRRHQAGDPQHVSRRPQAAKAHALMESNQHVGKIVLTW
jgi:NADPH2:quinone reductase